MCVTDILYHLLLLGFEHFYLVLGFWPGTYEVLLHLFIHNIITKGSSLLSSPLLCPFIAFFQGENCKLLFICFFLFFFCFTCNTTTCLFSLSAAVSYFSFFCPLSLHSNFLDFRLTCWSFCMLSSLPFTS